MLDLSDSMLNCVLVVGVLDLSDSMLYIGDAGSV